MNRIAGVPIVRNISQIDQDNYGRPGLSHITVAGSVLHGFREVNIVSVNCFYWVSSNDYNLNLGRFGF